MPDEERDPKKAAQKSRRLKWDPNDPEATKQAREEFNAARREGMTAYRYREQVSRVAEEVKRFPATAGEVLLTRQLVGG